MSKKELEEKDILRLMQELKYDEKINGDDNYIIDKMLELYFNQKEVNIELLRKFIIIQSKLINAEKRIKQLEIDNKVLEQSLWEEGKGKYKD